MERRSFLKSSVGFVSLTSFSSLASAFSLAKTDLDTLWITNKGHGNLFHNFVSGYNVYHLELPKYKKSIEITWYNDNEFLIVPIFKLCEKSLTLRNIQKVCQSMSDYAKAQNMKNQEIFVLTFADNPYVLGCFSVTKRTGCRACVIK